MSTTKKKDGSSPKKQLSIDVFLSKSTGSADHTKSRANKDETEKQSEDLRLIRSPRKRAREASVTKTPNAQIVNNNNNNNNNNKSKSSSKKSSPNNNNNNNNNNEKPVTPVKKPVKSEKSVGRPVKTVRPELPVTKKAKLLPAVEANSEKQIESRNVVSRAGANRAKKERFVDEYVIIADNSEGSETHLPESPVRDYVATTDNSEGNETHLPESASDGAEATSVEPGAIYVYNDLEKNTSAHSSDGDFILPHAVEKIVDTYPVAEFIEPDKDQNKQYTELQTMQDTTVPSDEESPSVGDPGPPEYVELETMRESPVGSDMESLNFGDSSLAIPLEGKVIEPMLPAGKKNFKCRVCDQDFPNRYFQRKHMLMEHENQLYECRICSFTSVNPEKLKSHIIKQHVIKKERNETVSVDEVQVDLDEMMTKQTPRKVMMEDGVAFGRDAITKMHFLCAMCDRVYTSKYSLERHVRCHTREKPYTCDVCNFKTSYREHMRRHMTNVHLIVHSDEPKVKYVPKSRRKTEEKNVSTEDDKIENDEADVSTQVEEPQEENIEQDESNNQENDDSESLGSGSFTDTSSFTTASTLSTSESGKKKRRNILRKRFECAACGMKGTHKADLVNHIKEKHPNAHIESLDNGDGSKVHLIVTVSKKQAVSRRMVITCPDCSKVFHDTWKYKVHRRSHTGVKPFGCSICAFYATSKMTIRDHIHRKHKDANNPKILLRTVLIDGTVDHVELNMPVREFKCEICEEVFKDNYHLKQHKKSKHTEALPFSCVECGHREWARASIIIHCISNHRDKDIEGLILRNNKPFTVGPIKLPTCQQCDRVFPYQSQLYIHQKQHTGERSFFCDICSYRTNLKASLEKHIMKHLEGERPKRSGRKGKEKNEATQSEQPINFVNVDESVSSVTPEKKPKQKKPRERKKPKSVSNANNVGGEGSTPNTDNNAGGEDNAPNNDNADGEDNTPNTDNNADGGDITQNADNNADGEDITPNANNDN